MSTKTIGLPEERPEMRAVTPLLFWMIIFSLLPAALLFGGMAFLMIVVALGLAMFVWVRPQEAAGAGMLYLFACHVVFPSSARFDIFAESAWEMYYWAVGLLIITVAAVARLGLRRVFTVPRSAKVFLLVAFAAALYGLTHGATVSYVLRQFYGVLLLIVYLGIALHAGSEELLLRRIRTFGVLCALLFLVYYIAVFREYGFHKEMGFNGAQASLLATMLFMAGAERRKHSWILGAIILLLVPVLLFLRSNVLTFFFAVPAAFAIRLEAKKLRVLCWSISALIAIPALFPPVAQAVIDEMTKIPVIERDLPSSAQNASTLYERGLQLAEAVSVVHAHPWLGEGLGSSFEWDSPALGFLQAPYVDNGWGYLFQKMGLLGAAAFLWFLVTVFRRISRESAALSACLLSTTVVTLFSQPSFFHFTTAPYLGTFAGLLLAKKYRGRQSETVAILTRKPTRLALPHAEGA